MFGFCHYGATFICVLVIRTKQEIKSMVVSMLQTWSQRYSSHNSNIKCVDSTIKCISFESFHYAINLNVVLFFMVFNDFDYMFISMYC